MAAKPVSNKAPASRTKPKRTSLQNLLLLLSLLPLITGILLVIAWAADITVWGSEQFQISMAFLLILASFVVSNAVQKLWILAAGWLLLVIADFILLFWIDLNAQILAFILAGLGILLLGYEFYRRMQKREQPARK